MYRNILLLTAALFLSISVSKASLYTLTDESLQPVSERLKQKEYSTAREYALNARPTVTRDFVLGVAAYRLEKWEEAERSLAGSADGFPLLGDFSLYYRADALSHLSRIDEALPLLDRLRKEYPESPLLRPAMLLSCDLLFRKGDYRSAQDSFRRYAAAYPKSSETPRALHRAAVCREKLGDPAGAVSELRSLWLAHPGKGVATEAEADLARLSGTGIAVSPYTGEELLKRGLVLLDRHAYREAAAALSAIPPESIPEQLRGRHAFKTAMAQYRARRNREAEEAFARLSSQQSPHPEYSVEAAYWYACTLDRTGRDRDAEAVFLRLAETSPASELADDALFQAALIRKSTGDHRRALALFRRLAASYPSSSHVPRALWETAWSLYMSGERREAAEGFARAAADPAYRERALYWRGRALEAAGDRETAREVRAVLLEEFPVGYYALNIERETGVRSGRIPAADSGILASMPLPDGYERAKALISLGLYEEARMEIRAVRSRPGSRPRNAMELAGLYLAMEDYNLAMALFPQSALNRRDSGAERVWAVLYPAAFREVVTRHTSSAGVDQSLAFALIRAESNFKPTARSSVGATGLMQLMPATARDMVKDRKETITTASLTRPDLNVRLGTRHLKDLLVRFDGNLVCAVAAYNAGATPVTRWRKNFSGLREDEFIESIPYPETREYVKKVLAGMEVYRRLYGTAEQPRTVAASSPATQMTYSSTGKAAPEPVSLALPQ